MATDLSGATLSELQVEGDTVPRAELVSVPDQQPDITKHNPDTYAGITGQRALERLHAQGLMPTADDIKGIENEALKAANDYHQHIAEQQQQAQTEILKRQAAVKSGTLAAEEATKSAAQEQQKQWEQGPGAVARAAEIQKAGGSGEIHALGADDLAKLDAMTNAYDSVQNLGGYFNKMMEKPRLGVGGQIKSLGGRLAVFADATSAEALAFARAKDAAIVPIGRGVMGETGASPTKEAMIELAQHTTMPRIEDDELTGNQGIFQLKQKILQNLQNLRDNRLNSGFDTTAIDKAIAKYNSDFISPEVQKYNPLAQSNHPLVQSGSSDQANAAIANATAGANAGVQVPSAGFRPTGPMPGQTPELPSAQAWAGPQQPTATPEQQQAVAARQQQALQLQGSLVKAPIESTGEIGKGLGSTLSWLQGVLPENWPQEAYQEPRPWETSSQQYVGTGQ